MNQSSALLTAFLLSLSLVACQQLDLEKVVKFQESDPFKNSMPASQFFEIDNSIDQVIESEDGIIMVIPANTFVDRYNKTIKAVRLEVDQLTLKEMAFANMATTSHGNALEADGTFYVNATTMDGQQLAIKKGKSILTTIPTISNIGGTKLYHGIQDTTQINWINPEALPTYLLKADLSLLNFRPTNFTSLVENNLHLLDKEFITDEFIDSLYYSFQYKYRRFDYKVDFTPADSLAEAIANIAAAANLKGKKLPFKLSEEDIRGYIYQRPRSYIEPIYLMNRMLNHYEFYYPHSMERINPKRIETIKNSKFEHTFLATKAFEARLRAIHYFQKESLLNIYTANLDKNLWEVDKMVADSLSKFVIPFAENPFYNFAAQKLTTIDAQSQYATALRQHYQLQFNKIKEGIAIINKKLQQSKDIKTYDQLIAERKALSYWRAQYELERYNVELSSMGWKLLAKPIEKDTSINNNRNTPLAQDDFFQSCIMVVYPPNIGQLDSMQKLDLCFYSSFNTGILHIENHSNKIFIQENVDTELIKKFPHRILLPAFAIWYEGEQRMSSGQDISVSVYSKTQIAAPLREDLSRYIKPSQRYGGLTQMNIRDYKLHLEVYANSRMIKLQQLDRKHPLNNKENLLLYLGYTIDGYPRRSYEEEYGFY